MCMLLRTFKVAQCMVVGQHAVTLSNPSVVKKWIVLMILVHHRRDGVVGMRQSVHPGPCDAYVSCACPL